MSIFTGFIVGGVLYWLLARVLVPGTLTAKQGQIVLALLQHHLAETLIICTHFSPRSRLHGEVMTDVASLNTYQFFNVKRRHFFMVDRSTSTSAWTTNRIVALVIGIVFLIVGVLGLIFDTTSGSVFGFDVDLVHNLVHVLTGILGLAAAFSGWSRRFNQVFGVIYLLVGLAGLVPALYFSQRLLGLMHVNAADNVLHLVVGLGAAAIGFFVNDSVTRGATASGRREDPMLRP